MNRSSFLNLDLPESRRQFMQKAAAACLGVTFTPLFTGSALGANKRSAGASAASAKSVIYLFMSGAMTHLDTFDLKPGREVQGETKGIQTSVPGMKFGEQLPLLAKQAEEMAVVRSLYTETGDHEKGRYFMRTSYSQIASIRHPYLGSLAQQMLGKTKSVLPDNVVISGEARHPGAGYLDPSNSPLPIGDANKGLENTKAPSYLKEDNFDRRMSLINQFDHDFQQKAKHSEVDAYNEYYKQAVELLGSDDLKAFDVKQEEEKTRDAYGKGRFGQGCLLARRLVERGVRFIEVNLGGWDFHVDIYDRFPRKMAELDKAMSMLLTDLKQKNLLDTTMVVLGTEFGRTPKINQNSGRDHHPGVFSGVLAGGGIKGGQFYGTSDEDGFSPDLDAVAVADFNATIAYAMGIDTKQELIAPSGRPFKVAHDGEPIRKLLK